LEFSLRWYEPSIFRHRQESRTRRNRWVVDAETTWRGAGIGLEAAGTGLGAVGPEAVEDRAEARVEAQENPETDSKADRSGPTTVGTRPGSAGISSGIAWIGSTSAWTDWKNAWIDWKGARGSRQPLAGQGRAAAYRSRDDPSGGPGSTFPPGASSGRVRASRASLIAPGSHIAVYCATFGQPS
jgi:hypothetical protein